MTEAELPIALALLSVSVLLALVGGVAWVLRSAPVPPVRDTELPTTEPADPDSPPTTVPGSVVWARPEWRNTIPTGPMPLDNAKD